MKRNFGAGPAALPRVAIERAREDLVDFEGTGLSVVEISHRHAAYEKVQARTIELLRTLLGIGDTHEVLLLQGAARGQFAMIPMNFARPDRPGAYVVTGHWARAAFDEAQLLGPAQIIADTKESDGAYRRVPRELVVPANAAYVHVCSNNTIYGTQFHAFPETTAPLVADMTSDILSRPIDIAKFGLVYAATQKNLGPSGTVVAIVRKDLLEAARTDIPSVWRYAVHAKHASLYYTPTTFAVATMRHVLEHAVSLGGLAAIDVANRAKAQRVYAALEARSDTYRIPASADARSHMNAVFFLPTPEGDARFIAEAQRRGMVGLKGHRTYGGVRASIYNWVPPADVDALCDLISTFET